MKPLFTKEKLKQTKLREKLPCECYECGNVFLIKKHSIMYAIKGTRNYAKFCSRNCKSKSETKSSLIKCAHCKKEFIKKNCQIKKTKNNFCSKSCSATYNNTHKTYGTRRSKLEIYIEEQLTILYPNLHIKYNQKEAINSELDIYIPSLNLAFELNGIFHYEPIYGPEKLLKIQNNDQNKFQACIEKNISLCIIDISFMKHFKKNKADRFIDIIVNIIIEKNKVEKEGFEPPRF